MTEKRFVDGGEECIEDQFLIDTSNDKYYWVSNGLDDIVKLLNELYEEVMELRGENIKFKLTVSEIIEDMQKYVDDNQLVYINQSYVDWIKKEVDTTLYSQKMELEE